MQVSIPASVQVSVYLRTMGLAPVTPCGGRGNCGKYRIKVVSGSLPIMSMDRVHLSEEELPAAFDLLVRPLL